MFTLKSSTFARAFAAAALIGSFAIAAPSFAASASAPDASVPVKATQVAATAKKGMHRSPEEAAQAVEDRIKTLHEKLGVTPDQESNWNDFAQAMRDNETGMGQAIQERRAESASMSAPEDLSAYQKIAQAHADGLAKVASAFQPVYDSMSDEQKKNADQVFGQFEGHRGVSKTSAHKTAKKAMPSSGSEGSSGSESAE